jgi:hypothetical protein
VSNNASIVITATGVELTLGTGVPPGGLTDQVLSKVSNAPYDMAWVDPNLGTVTQINSGTGLTGGPITETGTLSVVYGTATGTACQGDDARLSNARTPTAHAATHSQFSTDPITINEAQVTGLVSNLAGKVPTTRTLTASTGLTGGGDLSADRSFAVAYGTTGGTACQGDDVRLSNARTPLTHAITHGAAGTDPITITQAQVTDLTTDLAAKVPNIRTVTAGTGLTGGGALSSNITLTVAYGTTGTTACVGNDSRLSNDRYPTSHAASHAAAGTDPLTLSQSQITNLTADLANKVPTTRTVTAGTGLTGGGDLSSNITLTVAYGSTGTTACVGNDGRLSDARTPTGAASGDLAGTYPSPLVAFKPLSSGGTTLGAWRSINFPTNTAVVLPSGGVWAYFLVQLKSSNNEFQDLLADVAAGGSTVHPASGVHYHKMVCWRVS